MPRRCERDHGNNLSRTLHLEGECTEAQQETLTALLEKAEGWVFAAPFKPRDHGSPRSQETGSRASNSF